MIAIRRCQKLAALAVFFGLAASGGAAEVAGADLFSGGVRQIRIVIAPSEMESLRASSRTYVTATVSEGGKVFEKVGVHLKGSTGSFRTLDTKPALTLNFERFGPGQKFHGLGKIHLNNSVEDPSYLNEWLGGELFRAAGVPAPRVAHALVELNGRKLGLYVLKEGFTEDFLALHFRRTDGNLYDTGGGHEVTDAMERNSGAGPDNHADLQALAAAAQEPDLARRWQRLGQTLDVERFVSFMAMEVMAGHRDGYCLARNNFRIYHDPAADRMIFLPHGMDNLFGKADATLRPRMAGLVARAVLETPEGRRLQRARTQELFTNLFHVATLTNRVNERVARLRPALDRGAARELTAQAALVKERIARRVLDLARQLAEPEPAPPAFTNGVAGVTGWRMVDAPAGGKLDQAKSPDGRTALHIRAGPVTSASWRATVLLEPGRYRFEGRASSAGVRALKFGKNSGAGLRVAGVAVAKPQPLTGDSPWTKLAVEFDAGPDGAELICELRASAGEAWFDAESLQLTRIR